MLGSIAACCMGRIYMPGKVIEADITGPARKLPDAPLPESAPTQAWLEQKTIKTFAYEIMDFDFAADSKGRLYFIFSTPYAVYFMESDESASGEPEKFASDTDATVSICADANDVIHTVWAGDDGWLYHKYRPANETKWELEKVVEVKNTNSLRCIQGEDRNLHLAFNSYTKSAITGALSPDKWYSKLFYMNSSTGSFSRPVYQIIKEGPFSSRAQDIACDDEGNLYMSWFDMRQEGEPELYFKKQLDGVWDRDTKIAGTLEGRIKQHAITAGAESDSAHLLWATDRSIFYRQMVRGKWSDVFIIGDVYFNGNLKYMAADVDSNNTLHAFWLESNSIKCRQRTSGGWMPECMLASPAQKNSNIMAVYAKAYGNQIRLVWLEKNSAKKTSIVYKKGWANR